MTAFSYLGSLKQHYESLWHVKDPSNLAVTRILFGKNNSFLLKEVTHGFIHLLLLHTGLLMAVDIHLERGFSEVDHRFGDTKLCHFPLFDFIQPLAFQWMCLIYLLMWIGQLINQSKHLT